MSSLLKTAALSALAATAVLATTAPSASAYIACSGHSCWHARARYAYPRGVGIAVYPDTWRWSGPGWRWAGDRAGRGYWNHGRWRRF